MQKNDNFHIKNNSAIFLYGDTGKTTYYKSNFVDCIEIDARQILDIKSLLAVYIVKNTEFYSEKGILVNAMESGKTLVVKNIDCNIKLFNFLRTVIETRSTYFENEIIKAKDTFKIIFTAQCYMKNRHLVYVNKQGTTLKTYIDMLNEELCKQDTNKRIYKNDEIDNKQKMSILYTCLTRICNMKEDDTLTKRLVVKLRCFFNTSINTRADMYHTFSSLFFAQNKYKQRQEQERILLEILCLSAKCVENNICFPSKNFVLTSQVQNTIKDILYYVNHAMPVLMVGETGTGKTTLVQLIGEHSKYLFGTQAELKVVNFSSDIDLNDLIGTYQSNDDGAMQVLRKMYPFSTQDDKQYLIQLSQHIEKEEYNKDVEHVKYVRQLIQNVNTKIVFVEGVITKAIRNGSWILFDEINLASNETLNAICAIMNQKQLFIPEYNGNEFLKFHSNFRVFACMNPGNDHGKKDFDDYNFAKIIYDDFANNLTDIELIAKQILSNKKTETEVLRNNKALVKPTTAENSTNTLANVISAYFYDLRQMIDARIVYGKYLEPLVTGRNFTRFVSFIDVFYLPDLFEMFLYTQIHEDCTKNLRELESKYFDIKERQQNEIIDDKLDFTVYDKNKLHVKIAKMCIKTNTPVLLQGPTSTGKTSLVTYLSKLYNKMLYRINNHEQTEASDYLGSYTVNNKGEIVFKKGIFVQAVENGDWVLLDELNLAPSEVLEVLNRLLDNNKEIVLNGEVIKAHKNFRIFATQNLSYSGRKMLSKAFRNRFVEFNYNTMTQKDIKHLLDDKKVPQSYQKRMLSVYDKLTSFRSYNMLITIRDLFKMISRRPSDINELFYYGLNLLHEKQRTTNDKKRLYKFLNPFLTLNTKHTAVLYKALKYYKAMKAPHMT